MTHKENKERREKAVVWFLWGLVIGGFAGTVAAFRFFNHQVGRIERVVKIAIARRRAITGE